MQRASRYETVHRFPPKVTGTAAHPQLYAYEDLIMTRYEKLNYVEFPATDIPSTKAFFSKAFGWKFEDFGAEYSAFSDQGLDGGFFQSKLHSEQAKGAALLILLSDDLESTLKTIELCGGKISKPIFSFPGGRRFHFIEPSGNEFAVWAKLNT